MNNRNLYLAYSPFAQIFSEDKQTECKYCYTTKINKDFWPSWIIQKSPKCKDCCQNIVKRNKRFCIDCNIDKSIDEYINKYAMKCKSFQGE